MAATTPHSPWRLLTRVCLIAVASLMALGGVLYAAFWLPFRQTDDSLPYGVEVLPLEQEASGDPAPKVDEPTYGWVDRDAGIVRMPIDQAMRVASETLPVNEHASTAAEQRQRRWIPTDAGSGRFVRRAEEDPSRVGQRETSAE